MAELDIKFTGWKVILVPVLFVIFVGFRLTMLSDMKDDKKLMRNVELHILEDHFPEDVEKFKAAFKSGDANQIDEGAKTILSTKTNVESVQASRPLLNYSTTQDVVVKVIYSLHDDSGRNETRTKYYLYSHGSLLKNWSYQYETSNIRYYLNFI